MVEINPDGTPKGVRRGITKIDENLKGSSKVKDYPGWKDEEKPYLAYPFRKTKMMSSSELHFLYRMGKEFAHGNFANLGTYKGLSAATLAYGIQHEQGNGNVYAVDIFAYSDKDEVKQTIESVGLQDYITICEGFTNQWARVLEEVGFDFILIDADHHYETCKEDFDLWTPMLHPGGVVSFHDVNLSGVAKVVEELNMDEWEELEQVYRMRSFRKR
jgi:predicted O-methyltransferase YrrM